MIEFKPITLADKSLITSYTFQYAPQDCDFAFSNLCAWHFSNQSSYTVIDDSLVVRFHTEDNRLIYLMPIGKGNLVHIIGQLDEEAQKEGHPLRLQGVYPETQEKLEKIFPTLFEYTSYRDFADYVYLRKDLVELKGKNYQPKRNHINKFIKEYSYRYTPLTPDLLPQCLEFESRWSIEHDYVEQNGLKDERRALTYAIRHYEELELTGGAIWVDEEMVAFTFGAPINQNTFDINVEKANTHMDGAYSIINREFASRLPEQYIYINREEDLGIPGLRQSKLSYHPAVLLEKCIATKK